MIDRMASIWAKFVLVAMLSVVCVSFANAQGNVAAETKPPSSAGLSYGILVDTSGSNRPLLERLIKSVGKIADENKPGDETFLVSFVSSEKVVLRQDLTPNVADIKDAADDMYIEGGYTAILDALKFSGDHLADATTDRPDRSRALVMITDGEDVKSENKADAVIADLKKQHVKVYIIGVSDEKVTTKLIDRIARENRRPVYLPKLMSDLDDMISKMTVDMRK